MSFPNRLRTMLWRCQTMVWIAGWLVPQPQRATWRAGHNRRYWHWCHFLADSRQLTAPNRLMIARDCWRLFPEAFWLRFDRDSLQSKWRRILGSPMAFLVALAAGVTVATLASGVIPAGRIALSAPVADPGHSVTITLDGSGINGKYSRMRSDTLTDLASIWDKSPLAKDLSPFSWAPAHVLLPSRDLPVAAARVGPTFFQTLGVRAEIGRAFTPDDPQNCQDCVLLSHLLWQREFRSDRKLIGKQVTVNGTARTVIGILPAQFHLLSPGIAVWGLMDPAMLFTNFQRRVGAVASLREGAAPAALQRDLSDRTESAGYVHPSSQLQVTTMAAQAQRSVANLVWFLLLATASAILVVALRFWASGLRSLPQGTSARIRWLMFFIAKSSMLLALAAVTAWSAVHWFAALALDVSYPTTDEYSIWLYLPVAIVALSLSVRDQRSRCRKCLRRLELPVEIGSTGSVLLNWSGTEMLCPVGHGVLYVPDSPENALDQDRWSQLDDSWKDLFREP